MATDKGWIWWYKQTSRVDSAVSVDWVWLGLDREQDAAGELFSYTGSSQSKHQRLEDSFKKVVKVTKRKKKCSPSKIFIDSMAGETVLFR